MSIENDTEDVVDVTDTDSTVDEYGNDTTDWKAIAIRNKGIAQRFKTKLEKAKESKIESAPVIVPPQPATPVPQTNDLGELAYLAVNDIKGSDEVDFFRKLKTETGKDAQSLLTSTYFQTEFKDFKEKKATNNATPTGSKRSNNSSIDSVEYWLAKDELPPASEVELRQKVVNARINKSENKGVFYNS